MATIEKRGKGYRAKIYIGKVDGKSRFESISGRTKADVRSKALTRLYWTLKVSLRHG